MPLDSTDMSAIQWVNDEITNDLVTYGSKYKTYMSARYVLDAMSTHLKKENYMLYQKLDLNIANYLYEVNPSIIVSSSPWVQDDDYDLNEYLSRLTIRNDPDRREHALIKYNAKILNRIERNNRVINIDIPTRQMNVKLWARTEGAEEYGRILDRIMSKELWATVAPLNEHEPISYESIRKVSDGDALNYDRQGRIRGMRHG